MNDKTGRILKKGLDGNGYELVSLCNNGKKKTFQIHILVAEAYLEKNEDSYVIDHIDRNKLNNNVSNLRYVTIQINSRNRTKKTNCSSIYKGVYWYKRDKKWVVKIHIDYKEIYLGRYKTELEAGYVYNEYITNNNLDGFILNNIL
jgi:hypothetical protein